MPVHRKEYIHNNVILIDTMQFDAPEFTSAFCYYDGKQALLMDTGTSDNVPTVLEALKKKGINLEDIIGITVSHYHFDHGGGTAALWNIMKDINPRFRVYTTAHTKSLLNNAAAHLAGARTTFGRFVGSMDPIPDEAFVIVEPDGFLPIEFDSGARVQLVHTPGHTPDHCAPCVFHGERAVFIFTGEACGTLFNPAVLATTPTSMPPYFGFETYMSSVEKIKSTNPKALGFCHFGVVSGKEDLDTLFREHADFMKTFRDEVVKAFSENSSTAHVMKKTEYLWENRLNPEHESVPGSKAIYDNLRLALTYGMLVSLGLRQPKYEPKQDVQ